ncbi:MAG TPA: substrate-binding domain-containing protein [Bauldia sp.]|nr:substrate-binding domain-containing protein [Bauldia sp.]
MISTRTWGLILAAGLTFGEAAAQPAWLGADDLPTTPLACRRGEDEGATAPKPYDGGVPINPPARAGEPITVINLPRLTGVGYYAAVARGMREAAAELGNVEVKTEGATQISINQQITLIDNHVTSGVDGLLFAANDPIAIAPVLRKALANGINVVGYDADASPDARQWFVNRATPNGIAKVLLDRLADEIGEEGGFAIITSTQNAPVQARWIAEMAAYAAKCHPGLTWLGTAQGEEDGALSARQAQLLFRRHGADLRGLVTLTNFATPAAAEATAAAGKCGTVAVVGLATPNVMKPHIASGCVRSVVLWNPVDLGYAALHVLRAAADGTLQPGATSVAAGRLGELRVDGSEVMLGLPFVFTAENINGFDF